MFNLSKQSSIVVSALLAAVIALTTNPAAAYGNAEKSWKLPHYSEHGIRYDDQLYSYPKISLDEQGQGTLNVLFSNSRNWKSPRTLGVKVNFYSQGEVVFQVMGDHTIHAPKRGTREEVRTWNFVVPSDVLAIVDDLRVEAYQSRPVPPVNAKSCFAPSALDRPESCLYFTINF